MEKCTRQEMKEAIGAIAVMIERTEKAKEKFSQGTSQYTLLDNRLKALNIASFLISKELAENNVIDSYTRGDYINAVAPIASLISKSEKAQKKLTQGSWQHTMLGNNLKALYIASPLLARALGGSGAGNEAD
jgi:glutamate mutase epsilon subunit